MDKNSKTLKLPECEKLSSLNNEIMAINEFLEFINSKGIFLGSYPENSNFLESYRSNPEKLIYEMYHIDGERLEKERKSIWEDLKEKNG